MDYELVDWCDSKFRLYNVWLIHFGDTLSNKNMNDVNYSAAITVASREVVKERECEFTKK